MERLEPRAAPSSIMYALDVFQYGIQLDGPDVNQSELAVGDTFAVVLKGRAVLDAGETPAPQTGIFAWGVDLEWNAQWLRLAYAAPSPEFDRIASNQRPGGDRIVDVDPTGTTQAIDDWGGVVRDLMYRSGTDWVDLAAAQFVVIDAELPGRTAGVKIDTEDVDAFYSSLIFGEDRPVAAIAAHPELQDTAERSWHFFEIEEQAETFHNAELPADVDGSGYVSPLDALLVINDADAHGQRSINHARSTGTLPAAAVDVNDNGDIGDIVDALIVVNELDVARHQGADQ